MKRPTSLFHSISSAQRRYQESGNREAYVADVAFVALKLCAEDLAAANPRLGHLPIALNAAVWPIKGLVGEVHQHLSYKHDHETHHHDVASEIKAIAHRSKRYMDRDLEPVRSVLTHLHLIRT